jgi:hypothetical protein
VNIQNGFSERLTLDSSVQPTLDGSYWGISSNVANGNQLTQVLWMNRDEGITKGDTWVFTTSFQLAGITIQLQESLTGTTFSSDIQIQITAGTQSSGWADANTSLQFKGNDGNLYQIDGSYFLNGTYDDVTYTLLNV